MINENEKPIRCESESIPYPIKIKIEVEKNGFGKFEREIIVYKDWGEVYRRVLNFAEEIQEE